MNNSNYKKYSNYFICTSEYKMLKFEHGAMQILQNSLNEKYNCSMDVNCAENIPMKTHADF